MIKTVLGPVFLTIGATPPLHSHSLPPLPSSHSRSYPPSPPSARRIRFNGSNVQISSPHLSIDGGGGIGAGELMVELIVDTQLRFHQ